MRMITRLGQWTAFLLLIGSCLAHGDDRLFPDLQLTDLTRQSLVQPISFAASLQDSQAAYIQRDDRCGCDQDSTVPTMRGWEQRLGWIRIGQ